jgi:ribosomal-protein-alanine N-acetyltransferase
MRLPERIESARLLLRKPQLSDADAVYRWASDPVVTKYMSWRAHKSIDDSVSFLEYSDSEWDRWPAGPYLIEGPSGLVGSCGFAFRTDSEAEVGYILLHSVWGRGYATEALAAQVEASRVLGSIRLTAAVHPDNRASVGVLEKSGFRPEPGRVVARFPNLHEDALSVPNYVRVISAV